MCSESGPPSPLEQDRIMFCVIAERGKVKNGAFMVSRTIQCITLSDVIAFRFGQDYAVRFKDQEILIEAWIGSVLLSRWFFNTANNKWKRHLYQSKPGAVNDNNP